jgi:nucleoside-diphosphate-sugar epimerase
MKILITGAAGHIGSKLITKFKKNDKIFVVDSMFSARYPSLFFCNLKKKVFFIDKDILKIKNLDQVINHVDLVIHLAAFTDATNSVENSKIYLQHNFSITKKIIDCCLKLRKKIIFISSTSIYGTQKKLVDENCSKKDLNPQSPYAQSKLLEENYIKYLSKSKNLKSIILRFGTVYGFSMGMRFHTAVNKFCYQAALNQKLTVWKTALNQKRPYLNLNDAINFIKFVIKKNIFNSEIYNVVSGNYKVSDVIKVIKKIKKNLKVNYVNSPIMNQFSYEVSNNKAKKLGFKFKPKLFFEIKKVLKQLNFLN